MADLYLLDDSARHGNKELLVVGAGKEIIASIKATLIFPRPLRPSDSKSHAA